VKELLLVLISAALVNNFVLVRFLGLCPFFGVSKKIETAVGMGMAVIFVMVLASVVTWGIWNYVLLPGPSNILQTLFLPEGHSLDLTYLKTVAYILVIASLVQLTEMFLMKNNPSLYQALGVFLPLITTNCAVLGVAIINTQDKNFGLAPTIVHATGAGLGFTLALVLMAGIRERLSITDVPKALDGFPIAFITAGLMAIAFLGFSGMITE
jgi:electron transport complex protein RnfA